MKKINLYLFNLSNKYIMINFLFITVLILFINAIEISRIINETESSFFLLIILKIPSVISEIIPFVIIISISFLVRSLINNNELISIRNMGLSILDFYKPLSASIFLFGAINLIFINPISAKFERQYEKLTSKDSSDIYKIKFIEEGLWIKNINNVDEKNYINIEKINLDSMEAKNIKIFNSSLKNNSLIIAKAGTIVDKSLNLSEITIYNLINNEINKNDNFNLKLNFNKENVLDSLSNYKSIPYYKYYEHILNLKKFNIHSSEVSLYYISEILKPFFLIILGFVVLGFSGKYKRNENFFKVLFFSILIGFLIFLYKELISTMTNNYNIPFIFSYMLIFLLPLFIGLHQLIKIERD